MGTTCSQNGDFVYTWGGDVYRKPRFRIHVGDHHPAAKTSAALARRTIASMLCSSFFAKLGLALLTGVEPEPQTMRQENSTAHEQTRQRFDAAVEVVRWHFDVTAERLEARFGTLAEVVGAIDAKFERRLDKVETTIERTAANTQAMIKFSHAELDLRLSALEQDHKSLEETVSEPRSRIERIESSAH